MAKKHTIKKVLSTVFSMVVLPLTLLACNQQQDNSRLLAKVGDKELHLAEIDYLFQGKLLNNDDSTVIISKYVNRWVNEQLMVQAAEDNENINLETIERKTADFKNDLLIHALLNQEVKNRLDTTVAEAEMKAYYKAHQNDFQLNDYLVKVLYLKIPLDAPDIEEVGTAYRLNKQTDLETIETYAKMYASNFYYDIESWIYFDDLLKEIPLQDINKDRFILKRSKIRFEENGFYYFLNIVDYKLKNSTSPLSFERKNIKARIINERIKALRTEIQQDLINKGYEQNEVTIY